MNRKNFFDAIRVTLIGRVESITQLIRQVDELGVISQHGIKDLVRQLMNFIHCNVVFQF